jgi:sec-independent protein translocase protein TatC
VGIFCRPLFDALQKSDLNPQIFTEQLADGFMVYLKISLIVAAALASPWVIYQLWQFVSAGLYPHERRAVTRYIPLSIVLMISGMLFVYFLVLPWSLQFFIRFTVGIPLPPLTHNYSGTPDATQPSFVQTLSGDPDRPVEGRFWFDASENRLKMFSGGRIRVIPFGSDSLLSTHFTLPDYVDLVLQLLLTFGLAFQLPLVVMALAKLGIVDIDTLKLWRRYVYFALCVIAAALAPGDVVTATIALMIPLILLYELGIFLAKLNPRKVD